MKIIHKKDLLNDILKPYRNQKISVGLVPTMGALHEGHESLVKTSLATNEVTVVSIFVNPTQFNNKADLSKYPRNLERDVAILKKLDPSIVIFAPEVEEIYEDKVVSESFDFDGLENKMEGKHRKGHFDGVGTIVAQLFKIIKPTNAYFGEKDYQQLLIIKKMVSKLSIPVTIVPCPILREVNGLAMSSRNERLSAELRENASIIYKSLQTAKKLFKAHSPEKVLETVSGLFEKSGDFDLEYVEIANAETLEPIAEKQPDTKYRIFVAVYAGDVRLIDNLALN